MSKILRSLMGQSQTLDSEVLGAYEVVTKSGSTVSEDEATAILLRKIQLDVVADAPSDVGFANPMTAVNDMIVGGADGVQTKLDAPASEGSFTLKVVDGVMAWVEDTPA